MKTTGRGRQKCGINFEVTFVNTVRPIFKTEPYETNMLRDDVTRHELERSENPQSENNFQQHVSSIRQLKNKLYANENNLYSTVPIGIFPLQTCSSLGISA